MKLPLLLFLILMLSVISCKKETKIQSPEKALSQMKNDPELKDLYTASKLWVCVTGNRLNRFDSVSVVRYLRNMKDKEHASLLVLGQTLNARYSLSRYPEATTRSLLRDAFSHYFKTDKEKAKERVRKQAEVLRFDEPIIDDESIDEPILQPFYGEPIFIEPTPIDDYPQDRLFSSNKKCYDWLVEDVSECDEDMVIESGLSLLGLFAGPWTYFIAQGAAFIHHSRCVDKAQRDYKRCLISEKPGGVTAIDTGERLLVDDVFKIYNPDNIDEYVIMYGSYIY